jgi:hypothetical protein
LRFPYHHHHYQQTRVPETEALSGVASGVAVASLSIQLIQSVGTIKTFVRNVKDATKELERLSELLGRLGALLEELRDVMERQSSLERHHFLAPSMTIFMGLQSCEKTLQPLSDIVEKLSPSTLRFDPAVTSLKSGFKASFKAKDIAEFEMRMERDITNLHATLGTNTTAIL